LYHIHFFYQSIFILHEYSYACFLADHYDLFPYISMIHNMISERQLRDEDDDDAFAFDLAYDEDEEFNGDEVFTASAPILEFFASHEASFSVVLILQSIWFPTLRSNKNWMDSPSRLVRSLALSLILVAASSMSTILPSLSHKKMNTWRFLNLNWRIFTLISLFLKCRKSSSQLHWWEFGALFAEVAREVFRLLVRCRKIKWTNQFHH